MFVLKILHFIIAIGVIVGILLQSGKSAGLSGAIDGGATTFCHAASLYEIKLCKQSFKFL